MTQWRNLILAGATIALLTIGGGGQLLAQTASPSEGETITELVQVGADINGENAQDLSGESVSLSADGQRLAIGAAGNNGNGPASGHVRVFDLVDGAWIQVGADIDGENVRDFSGGSVSLSADGSRVAIGAIGNAGNGAFAGHVRVFDFVGGAWVQLGADIDGENAQDFFGGSVSLSADGRRLAIGADNNAGNGASSGHVRVFDFVGGAWVQLGADIDGENAQDFFGGSVSLSADGRRVAIGAERNDGVNGDDSGHVRVFELVGGAWVQLGADIDGENAGDGSGGSVSLSAGGSRVAIGATNNNGDDSGHVRVFELVGGAWVQLGADIDSEDAQDFSGVSVSLSADGRRVAIGARGLDSNVDFTGHVRVFEFVGGAWVQVGADIDGENAGDGSSVSFSADGQRLAIGAGGNDGNGINAGQVRVFDVVTSVEAPVVDEEPVDGSSLTVRAFGHTGHEQFEVRVDGVVVGEFGTTTMFAEYEVGLPVGTLISDVEVAFTNDARGAGFDRNLVVDWVKLDGVLFETRAASTSSTGTFNPETRCTPGSVTVSETLHCNGAFIYGGSSLTVRAFGHTGHEQFEVRVDGVVVGEFGTTTMFAEYEVGLPVGTLISDVEVAFTNDARGAGFDRNLVVDWVKLDGVLFETRAVSTSSTGTFNSETRCTPGSVTVSETLHCNGAFIYG